MQTWRTTLTLIFLWVIDESDDPLEPAPIINALDASLMASVLADGGFDATLDFDRNGVVDQDDFDIMIANYLLFSPVVLV